MTEITANSDCSFLSEVIDVLPTKCLLDKGITGCGGTTLEINSNRNSLILVPNVNIVLNKTNQFKHLIGVYGEVSLPEFRKQMMRREKYKKIIATYDALPKLINWVGDKIFDYFLLIDEYHILFNYYRFRYKAISFVLQNYKKFKDYCFMTATPLNDDNVLKELHSLPIIKIKWPQAVGVNVELVNTGYTSKELTQIINQSLPDDCNLHIFINSINTIKSVIANLTTNEYRTICSKDAERKNKKFGGKLNVESITSPVKKINFYTATAFEGSDIYDPKGKTIVVSDTNISQSLMDISTLFVQICGRLRDSIYKDQVTFICNTKNHRYLQYKTLEEFSGYEDELQHNAECFEVDFLNLAKESKEIQLGIFDDAPDAFWNRYLNKSNNAIEFDVNLRKMDHQNYIIINRIFANPFSVLKTISEVERINECTIQTNPYWEQLYSKLPSLIIDNQTFKNILKELDCPFSVSYASQNLNDCFKARKMRIDGKCVVRYDFTKLKLLLGK